MARTPVSLPPESPLMTIRDAASSLGISKQRVETLIEDGSIPAFKHGIRSVRILKSDLALYLESSRVTPKARARK